MRSTEVGAKASGAGRRSCAFLVKTRRFDEASAPRGAAGRAVGQPLVDQLQGAPEATQGPAPSSVEQPEAVEVEEAPRACGPTRPAPLRKEVRQGVAATGSVIGVAAGAAALGGGEERAAVELAGALASRTGRPVVFEHAG